MGRGPHSRMHVPEGDPVERFISDHGRPQKCTCGDRIACRWCSDQWGWLCCKMTNKKECSGNKVDFTIGF